MTRFPDDDSGPGTRKKKAAPLSRRSLLVAGSAAAAAALVSPQALTQTGPAAESRTRFRRVSPQFIAALGDPDATSGSNAHLWGLWRLDPGPRGVRLSDYDLLKSAGNYAPARWKLDDNDWWLEEHGLIMEAPEFPMPPGRYVVTGDRDVQSVLTVEPARADGTQPWSLANGATIYDVTHLRCRSARYTPASGAGSCSPTLARQQDFPVSPGAPMPPVENCSKQDYSVLIVIAVADT